MALTAGTRLGAYEIAALLGAGGMGEVYRARDTRLDRTVAIKVLPSDVASTRELRERFEREARTVAALNHPHICTLHDVGREGDVEFLVMEYLEGETLQDRLQHGPLPLDHALRIAGQIADALAAAHRAGVVHRDLKPGNIFLVGRPADGRRGGASGPPLAKLLDFGLAKPAGPMAAGSASMLPTTPRALTVQGTILGTFQYMAPEQLEGLEADARTDIFSFGAVLYEMLTGRKAFEGKSHASLIAAILEHEPARLSSVQPSVPRQLEHVVARCLAKNPDERWQAAADLHRELQWAAESPAQERLAAQPAARVPIWRRPVSLGRAIALGSVAALLTGAGPWMLLSRGSAATDGRVARLSIVLPPGDDLAALEQGQAVAVSPSGGHIAYVAISGGRQQLFVREIERNEGRALNGTEGASAPFFSPEGQWIAFFAQGMLKKVSITAGTVQTLSDAPFGVGGSWGEDGNIYFAPANISGIVRISADGGTPTPVTELDRAAGEVSHRWPQVLLAGRLLIFTVWTGPASDEHRVEVQRLDTGQRAVVVRGGGSGRYVPTGHVVYTRGDELFALPFDITRVQVTGQPVRLPHAVRFQNEGSNVAVSETGTLVYAAGSVQRYERRLVWVARDGRVEPLLAPPRAYYNTALAPDGRRAAVNVSAGTEEIWTYDFVRRTSTRLTTGTGSSQAPRWTPDGTRIFYRGTRNGFRNLWSKTVDDSSTEERISTGEAVHTPSSWSTDGQWLLYINGDPVAGADIWTMPSGGDRKPQVVVRAAGRDASPRLSPDGRLLAYVSDESGRGEVFVQPFPGPGARVQLSTDGGLEPIWASDGRELFYRDVDRMMAVTITASPTIKVGTPHVLFEGRFEPSANGVAGYDVAPDGRFLMVQPLHPDPPTNQIQVVLNWFEELRRTAAN